MPNWAQDAGNAQRTGYIDVEPTAPWSVLWSWNGADKDGGTSEHRYTAPAEARPVASSTLLFVPAGERGIYALELATGALRWHVMGHPVAASPAYDATSDTVLIGSTDGNLVKITASTGAVAGRVHCGAAIRKAVLVQGSAAYVVTDLGECKKVTISSMAVAWTHTPTGSPGRATIPPAYSPSRSRVIYATSDLYVHAVNDTNGASSWRVKPTTNTAVDPYTYEGGWPVIAETHGYVFIAMQLAHTQLDNYPSGSGNIYPSGSASAAAATIRTWLTDNSTNKHLFCLDLDDGSEAFVPAVGYGSVESMRGTSAYGVFGGAMPVIKSWGGTEVAYCHFRNGAAGPPDYRWDGHMGEMVLDGSTVSGLAAGDLRFVRMSKYFSGTPAGTLKGISNVHINDERCPLTMAGTALFHAHWGASEGVLITDRSSGVGLAVDNQIVTTDLKPVLREISNSSTASVASRYQTNTTSTMFSDSRSWASTAYFQYKAVTAPPGPVQTSAYSAGLRPRYTFVTDQYLIVVGNGGDILALRHQGQSAVGAATGLSLAGPLSGKSGAASQNFTVSLYPLGATLAGTVTVTPSDSSGGGTFSPTSVTLRSEAPQATFTYTAGSTGSKTISVTNTGGLVNPSALSYVAR